MLFCPFLDVFSLKLDKTVIKLVQACERARLKKEKKSDSSFTFIQLLRKEMHIRFGNECVLLLCMSSKIVSVLHYLSFVVTRHLRDQNH